MNIFAYGSNLDPNQMQRRCPSAILVTPARLPEHRLAFTRYSKAWEGGVADVVPDPGSDVWGLVWSVDSADLPLLDHFESVPTGYVRCQSVVRSSDGEAIDVWLYRVVKKVDYVPPPNRYLEIILRACDENGLPARHRRSVESAARGVQRPDRHAEVLRLTND